MRAWIIFNPAAGQRDLRPDVVRVAGEARADDGLLDAVIIEGPNPPAALWNPIGFARRGVWPAPRVRVVRGRVIEVSPGRPPPVQVDGDPHGKSPVRFECAPGALRVFVPRSASLRIFGVAGG